MLIKVKVSLILITHTETTSQNKRKGSIGKKKKKWANHLKKQVFDYKVIFKQENKEGREVSFQLKNLVPKIKLENLTKLEEWEI